MREYSFDPESFQPPGGSLPVPSPGRSAPTSSPVPPGFPGEPKGTDKTPAWLTPGEYVVPAGPAMANRELLDAIKNSVGPISQRGVPSVAQMSMGGEVKEPQYMAKGGWMGGLKGLLGRRGNVQRRMRKKRSARMMGGAMLRGHRGGARRFANIMGADEPAPQTSGAGSYGASASAGGMSGLGEAFGEISKVAERIPGPWGRVVEYGTKFAEVLLKSADALKNWSEDLHKFNMQFAEFSGAMAGVQARQEVRDINLSMERGQRTAGSAEYLAEGKSQLAKATSGVEDTYESLKNAVAGALDRFAASALEKMGISDFFRKAAEAINKWLGSGSQDKDKYDLLKMLDRASHHDKKQENKQRPPRHKDTDFSGTGGDFG